MFAASKTASVTAAYQISRSLRFNNADTAYLNRTPASASNRKTWTWSGWVKRNSFNVFQYFFGASPDSFVNTFSIASFGAGASEDQLRFQDFQGGSQTCNLRSNQVLRDPSAWYHIVLAADTTQATDTNRFKMYVNGVQITSFSTATYPTQNTDLTINNNVLQTLGYITSANTFNGYMTEVNFIDGTQLTPSSFGQTDAQTGVWGPKAYSGSYGTNGFYVNFSDNSNTTAATLGKDYSGNGNNWTPNNFSVTAGAGNDSLVDSPTSYGTDTGVGGTVRGNYCTMNPLQNGMTNAPRNGNLEIAGSADIYRSLFGTFGVSSGKWYFEVVITSGSGVTNVAWSSTSSIYQYAGEASTSYGYELENGNKINNGGTSAYGSALTTNDVFMCAVDMDNLKLFFGKNGTWFASSDPVAGTSPAYTFSAGTYFFQMRPYTGSSSVVTTNFGQRAFAYTAPSGFKALCTQNLPTPTIGATTDTQAGKFFNPVLYTGNATSRSITGVGFQPDWVWIKDRTTTNRNVVFDAVRGTTKRLITELDIAEDTGGGFGVVTAFNSDGFSVDTGNNVNQNTDSYVSWNWKANGAGSTNTSGSITSTVSASTTSGFSVATYTGTGVAGTIGHGLAVAPSMIIVKSRSAAGAWGAYHASLGNSSNLVLNTTAASASSSTIWNATSPTSSVFSVGINTISNTVTVTYVAYCFAEVAGYSKFGSYTGNGSTDGPFVFTNMRPAYVMIKRTDSTGDWIVWDSVRNTYNVTNSVLFSNSTQAEATGATVAIDLLSNGFKLRNTDATENANGGTYIFMALATNPFKFSLAR